MTPLDLVIRQNLDLFDNWNNESGALNPINSDYFQMLELTRMATIRGYKAKVKEVSNIITVYELAEWYLFSCAPHSADESLEEWYNI